MLHQQIGGKGHHCEHRTPPCEALVLDHSLKKAEV